jgi:hypothetical protein
VKLVAEGSNPSFEKIVVCSFYTNDEYYASHAEKLSENLQQLGVGFLISVMDKKEGEDWADVCRKKVGFLAKVCAANPSKKVFWIDIDCELLEIPDYIVESTADIIGFQRSFGSPLNIGYKNRTRFWEPCFWGINNTLQARKMIEDAYILEQNSSTKATDDFFFEEGWRANATNLTFQLIPSNAVANRGDELENTRPVFFKFGSSGKVVEFKNQVEQHQRAKSGGRLKRRLKRRTYQWARRIQKRLPEGLRRRLRKFSDKSGITKALTGEIHIGSVSNEVKALLGIAKLGNSEEFSTKFDALRRERIPTSAENRSIASAISFLSYRTFSAESSMRLSWWSHPYPGNYGDWLSPYLTQKYSHKRIEFQPLNAPTKEAHLIAIGSIGRFIKKTSIVVGTGVSSDEFLLEPNAKYFSLRGPRTAELLKKSGGPTVDSFGDPAILVSRIYPVIRGETNGKVALVRHPSHRSLPIRRPENIDELSLLRSHPSQIEEFFIALNHYDAVVTSALHVFITCQAYGIPVALVTFKGFEGAVHGNGLKYSDYSEGVGMSALSPTSVPLDLRHVTLDNLLTLETISEEKLNEVEMTLLGAIDCYQKITDKVKVF